ncbi:Peptidoglycan glycosyltransferase [Anaeromyxobacter dehalogenans 2CP-1]|uniref:Peptidoglycan glycosyltransferase n=1 Tax=Anaeromyxobacter dehalogenans (strain ATCC BAA-258 / DSM 21875 / 2CP-1) TaxID=455488 RepID=B8J8E2_ANAD2|nr:penicillin-binding protein [Anaeromyxobacter dehalogenans]ACL67228.1 Peptidoglycan glycosyltransferase [Anaeromyxobacter dehalogenans 2CP-1]
MRAGPDPRAARWIAIRITVFAVLLAAGLAAVAGRVFWLQVLQRDALAGEAVDQYLRELVLRPRRGVITDRSGVLLAGSADAQSAYADPKLLAEHDRSGAAVRRIARILKQDPRALQRKLAKGGRFVWLERRIPPAEAAALRKWIDEERVRAVRLVPETRRYYPKLELAAQVLGVVDDDGAGREGVELAEDELLRGEPARVPSLRDGRGRVVLADAPSPGREREGARVELTLDQGLQVVTERALARAVTGSRALSGTAVAMDPRTGEVLALASYPVANANAPRSADAIRNRPVTDAFEPGSTIKTFVIAAALDRGAVGPKDPFDCGAGRWPVGSHVIHDTHPVGWAGPSRILVESSNIGAAHVGARLGREGVREALLAFGFGERPGIGLPGEIRGQVLLARSDIALATQSFGQGPITASPLQVTTAMAAIANGGALVRPRLVKRVLDPATGQVLEAPAAEVVRQAVRPEVAAMVARWLVGVVEEPKGTGKRARLDGWRAAGKTGTAQKPDRISGGYSSDRHYSSFVGFAPAEQARIAIGVFIDEPRGEIYGGEVAAPAFREIAEYALRMMGVPPDPSAVRTPPPAAVEVAQAPPADEPPEPPAVEWADRRQAAMPAGSVAVPALAGLPMRAAIRRLEELDLAPEPSGSGRVVGQTPAAGKVVGRGSRVRVTLAPAG